MCSCRQDVVDRTECYRIVEDKDVTTYFYRSDTGDATMSVYKVFPGIELIYNSVHMDFCKIGRDVSGSLIEIHHCREGRIEQELDNEFLYLMPGDLSIVMREKNTGEYSFPLRHYHGITIVIDTDKAPRCFSCFLKDVNVQPLTVARKLCSDKDCYVIRSEDYIEHIFYEIYKVPESYKIGYLKIKIMELFLILSSIEPEEKSKFQSIAISKAKVTLAKRVAEYLAENLDKKISVIEISKIFHVSQTHLQNIFKGVYGVPIYSYTRILKMQAAALDLIHTDLTIMEIAGKCGYDNGSKFASAFREVMGETPNEYRRLHNSKK